jgi:hypothetical protein
MAAGSTARRPGRPPSVPGRRRGSVSSRSPAGPHLLQHALATLVATAADARPDWLGGPLVLISAGVSPAARAVASALGEAGAPVSHWQGPQLGREIGTATRRDGLHRLLQRLTGATVCTVDAVDQLGGTGRQRTFVQLFDAAVAAGTMFCLSLATPPAAADMEPHLASRLTGGLVITLPPDTPTDVPGAVVRAPGLTRILKTVARHHDLTYDDLVGPARCRAVASARSMAMYLARQLTDASLYAIGRAYGGRDHTTVMHGVRVVSARLARDPSLAAELARLSERLGGCGRHPGHTAVCRRDVPACRQDVGSAAGSPRVPDRHEA